MRFFLIIFLSLKLGQISAQNIYGEVYLPNEMAVEGAVLRNKDSGKWAITNAQGKFSLEVGEHFEVVISFLGMDDFTLTSKNYKAGGRIVLKEKTLYLDDVEVTATQKQSKTSSSLVLDKYAISQFQAFSLSDVLQQLPGQTIKAPEFNKTNILNLRSQVNTNVNDTYRANNAFGVSFIIDDVPISNDENMQTYYAGGLKASRFSTAGTGIDLREFPASSIEKIEVISGVADARYGNLTTGAVVVERKAGVYPLQGVLNMLSGGNSVSFNRGFHLGEKAGSLSVLADYLDANTDPRNTLSRYKRITLGSIWSSSSFTKKLRNTLSVTIKSNISKHAADGEHREEYQELAQKNYKSIQLSNRIGVQLDKKYLEYLKINTALSYAKDEDKHWFFINNGGRVIPVATTTTIAPGVYSPVAYRSLRYTQGKPLNVNVLVQAEKKINGDKVSHFFTAGTSFNFSDNLGQGIIANENSMAAGGTLSTNKESGSFRPLNFNKTVTSSKLFAVFVQNNMSLKTTTKQSLYANLGLRYELNNGFASLSPRFNTAYEFSSAFKVRLAMGLATKAPSLAMRFPGHIHLDKLLKDERTSEYSYNLVQTVVEPRSKVDLKPSYAWKYETGADLHLPLLTLNLTAHYSRTSNVFAYQTLRRKLPVPKVAFIPNSANANGTPLYHILGYNDYIFEYKEPINSGISINKGIEFTGHFQRINVLNLKISFAGSYVHTTELDEKFVEQKNTDITQEKYFIGLHTPRSLARDNMSLRFTLSHHLPNLGLLTSLTIEQFIFSTQYTYSNTSHPRYYLDTNLQQHSVTSADIAQQSFLGISRYAYEAQRVRTPIYHNFHLRLTKEMSSGLSLSVYVVNFLNHRPYVTLSNKSGDYKNEEISFGGSIKYILKTRK